MTPPGALARLSPGLTARIGLACIGTVTLGFILICSVVLIEARHDATAQAATDARNIATSIAQDIARNLDLYDLSLEAVVQGLQIPGLQLLDPQLRQKLLFDRATKAPYFGFINAIDETGAVIADSHGTARNNSNWSNRDYFTAQRDDARDLPYIGRPFRTNRVPTISISRRMSHPDGSFAGVVVGTLLLGYVQDLFAHVTIGPHAVIELLRADGMVLMRQPLGKDDIGSALPPDAPFFRVQAGGQVNTYDSVDQQRRHFLFLRVGSLPLVVGVGLADADIYDAWRHRAQGIFAVVAALAAINLLLLLVVRYALLRREAGLAALRLGDAQRATLMQQREAAMAAATRTAATKTRFLATMSHELRTPLNSILGYAEMLSMDGKLQPVQTARVAAMRSAGDHLREVVNRVLDFCRDEAEDAPLPLLHTDLPALMSQCRAIAEPMAAAKGLTLTCSFAPDAPLQVLADAASIRQVLVNLMGNAVKFTNHGGVTLLVAPCTTGIRFAVEDSGIGVPAERRDKLFQPYERLDADRIGIPGTGLGLAIAARLVGRMGGRIGHDDNPSGGSVFWVELPLRVSDAPPPSQCSVAPPQMRPLRVLVADDSAMNRDVAAAFLHGAGHMVVEAADGEEAARLVAAEEFDVVLMDLRMPLLDGIQATRRIRALSGHHGQTPVIAVTAEVQEDNGAALLAAGFQGWLIKPIDQKSLLAAVAAAAPAHAHAAAGAVAHGAAQDLAVRFPQGLDSKTAEHHLEILETQLVALADLLRDFRAAGGCEVLDDAPALAMTRLASSPDTRSCLSASASGATHGPATAGDPRRPGVVRQGNALAELAHHVAGDSGQMGFTALSMAAQRYVSAWEQDVQQLPGVTAALCDAVEHALEKLNQRRDFIRRAAMSSAKLP